MKWALSFLRKCRRGELWLRRLDALGAAALLLDKRVVYETEFTPDQVNGALFLQGILLAYREENMAGGTVWRVPSRRLLQKWFVAEARRLGIDLVAYEPKRSDSSGVTLIPVSDYQAPR